MPQKSNHSQPMKILLVFGAALLLCGCTKAPSPVEQKLAKAENSFTHYVINSGEHYATHNPYKTIETDTLRFVVRFDSTAVYKTTLAENQYDINKLYGFADNGATHHQYSARFGWAWHDGALHLYGYVYNEGKRESKHLGTVPIGAAVACTLAVTATQYIFSFSDVTEALPRSSTTPKGKGYLLYPYFGGDEAAPHTINICIQTL